MVKSGTFKDYVKTKFEDEMTNTVAKYIEDNEDSIDWDDDSLCKVGEKELHQIEVQSVRPYENADGTVGFDVIATAEVEIHEADYHYDETEVSILWFKLECVGTLEKDFSDFRIHSTEEYTLKKVHADSLTNEFVPIIHKEELDSVAEDFLSLYYPQALKKPVQIDPLQLATNMGLKVFTAQLSKQSDIFGQIFFRDCTTAVIDPTTGHEVRVELKKGSILVDPNVIFLRSVGSYNNTIVHECVHWALHKKHFDLLSLYNPELSEVKCTVSGDILGRESESAKWMEWQANALAPRIQMPLTSVKVKINEYWNIYREALREWGDDKHTDFCYASTYVIESIANFYGVSKMAAKLRIIEVGYEEAMCALTYLDGAYVPPHSFKEGFLKSNETFSISTEDALIQCLTNTKLFTVCKYFTFIENHFVLNHPKFILSNENGTFLTEYARCHMGECALKFTLKIKKRVTPVFILFCSFIVRATMTLISRCHFLERAVSFAKHKNHRILLRPR